MTDDFDDVDFDADDLGFTPAVSATGVEPSSAAPDRRAPRFGSWRTLPRWRRRFAGLVIAFMSMAVMGGLFGLFAQPSNAADTPSAQTQAQIDTGQQLFATSCVTCHGANLQGVADRGPSLIGVGSAAVYFQVSTGRMPANGQAAEQPAKPNKFTEAQTEALAAYVQSIGGGPQVRPATSSVAPAAWPRAASCSGSTARPATARPARGPRCRPASRPPASTMPRPSRSTRPCCRVPRACRCSTTTS